MTILVSCGKQDFPDYKGERKIFEHEETEGTFVAKFKALNSTRRRLSFSALMWVRGRQLYVRTALKNGEPHVRYQQYIHTGSKCPDGSADLDKNSLIDAYEVRQASGEMLIPLDKNIKFQEKGMEWFPVANKDGVFYYSRATALPDMMVDLYDKNKNSVKGLTKLSKNEKLDLEKRTIVIYGTATDPLKPVACGEIKFDSYF